MLVGSNMSGFRLQSSHDKIIVQNRRKLQKQIKKKPLQIKTSAIENFLAIGMRST